MWATKYEKCIVCGTTGNPHWAMGMCNKCHPRFSHKNFEFLPVNCQPKSKKNTKQFIANSQMRDKISKTQKLRRSLPVTIRANLTKEALFNLYITKQKSFGDIAKEFGCSRTYILNLCKEYNIKVKTKGEARIQAYKQSKFVDAYYRYVNEDFFSSWSVEMAYVLGFLFADGCLTRCVRFKSQNFYNLQITIMDLDLLNKIKSLMKSEHKILPRTNTNGKLIYGITIGRMKITQDLMKLGLTPRKSLTAKFPNMSSEYINHFIRGYFDGDGSICRQGIGWKVSIVSGSKDFIEGVKENLEKFSGVNDKKLYKHKDANAYTLGYNSRDNITKIFRFFYDDYALKNELYLARKYKLFKEAINEFNNWTPKQIESSERYKRRRGGLTLPPKTGQFTS